MNEETEKEQFECIINMNLDIKLKDLPKIMDEMSRAVTASLRHHKQRFISIDNITIKKNFQDFTSGQPKWVNGNLHLECEIESVSEHKKRTSVSHET